ncbi:MAG TPA: ABC transporter substrate-binding protein [Methylomirabilota bacterium]|jgi:putative ABC transport system substrate-binding protein
MAVHRLVLLVVPLALLAGPPAGEAQPARVARVGYLSSSPSTVFARDPFDSGLLQGLREQGYTEGRNLAIEYRSAQGRNENFPALAAELVRLNVDVIVAHSAPAVLAAKQATTTIPIVLLNVADPVGVGLVASLARPGGNVTGVSSQAADFTAKLLQLAKETVRRLDRVAVITTPTNPALAARVRDLEGAASALSITLDAVGVGGLPDIQQAFPKITQRGTHAVVVLADNLIWFHRAPILELATRSQLPTICMFKVWAETGCLLAYGPSLAHMWYQAGVFAGKLLNGASAATLPVEQPTKFELVINAKTARALGLAIPSSVLARADHVIE